MALDVLESQLELQRVQSLGRRYALRENLCALALEFRED